MTLREWVDKYLSFDGDEEEIRKEDIMNWVDQLGMWNDAFNAGMSALRETMKMTPEEEQAYRWALSQQFNSVAAKYARILAGYIKRCE